MVGVGDLAAESKLRPVEPPPAILGNRPFRASRPQRRHRKGRWDVTRRGSLAKKSKQHRAGGHRYLDGDDIVWLEEQIHA
ncbi:hypothetical protein GCM10009735_38090 [Actinomadura chokoriensis]